VRLRVRRAGDRLTAGRDLVGGYRRAGVVDQPRRLGQRPWLLGQLPAALGFELAALSPRAVNLTGSVPAAECDDGRHECEYERADRGDDLQHDDDGDDGRDYGKDCFHRVDYRIRLDRKP